MNDNTKKLHALMKRHKMTAGEVAAMLGRKPNTVRVWRVKETARPIPDDTLQLLALKLAERKRRAAGHRGAAA